MSRVPEKFHLHTGSSPHCRFAGSGQPNRPQSKHLRLAVSQPCDSVTRRLALLEVTTVVKAVCEVLF